MHLMFFGSSLVPVICTPIKRHIGKNIVGILSTLMTRQMCRYHRMFLCLNPIFEVHKVDQFELTERVLQLFNRTFVSFMVQNQHSLFNNTNTWVASQKPPYLTLSHNMEMLPGIYLVHQLNQ